MGVGLFIVVPMLSLQLQLLASVKAQFCSKVLLKHNLHLYSAILCIVTDPQAFTNLNIKVNKVSYLEADN